MNYKRKSEHMCIHTITHTDIKHLMDETESNIQFIASGQDNIGQSEAVNWMLDEVKSNKCFIILKKIGSKKLVVWKRLVSTKVTVT